MLNGKNIVKIYLQKSGFQEKKINNLLLNIFVKKLQSVYVLHNTFSPLLLQLKKLLPLCHFIICICCICI